MLIWQASYQRHHHQGPHTRNLITADIKDNLWKIRFHFVLNYITRYKNKIYKWHKQNYVVRNHNQPNYFIFLLAISKMYVFTEGYMFVVSVTLYLKLLTLSVRFASFKNLKLKFQLKLCLKFKYFLSEHLSSTIFFSVCMCGFLFVLDKLSLWI